MFAGFSHIQKLLAYLIFVLPTITGKRWTLFSLSVSCENSNKFVGRLMADKSRTD